MSLRAVPRVRWTAVCLGVIAARVVGAPTFVSSPPSRLTVPLSARLELPSAVAGGAPTSFRWSRNGLPLAGADSATLVIAAASARDTGWYRVTATDATGTTESPVIFVNVVVPSARLIEVGLLGASAPAAPEGVRPLVAVAAGRAHSLALQEDGTVIAWGSNAHGESSVPENASPAVALAASEAQSLALRADGTVVAWGSNAEGEANVPAGLANVVAIAAGGHHALALRSDGRVIAWGRRTDGEVAVPSTLARVVAIAAGPKLSLALDAAGAVAGWGTSPALPVAAGGGPFVGVAAGSFFGVAWRADGAVVCWPRISVRPGQPYPADLTGVAEMAVAGTIGVATFLDGTVTGWAALGVVVPIGGIGAIVVPGFPAPLLPNGIAVAPLIAAAAGQEHVVLLRDGSRDPAPAIQSQPASVAANGGGRAELRVGVTSTIPVRYQWSHNGVPLPGATTASLTLRNVMPTQAGTYTVVATSQFGSVTSAPATVTVFPLATVVADSPVRQSVRLGGSFQLGVTVASPDAAGIQWRHNGLAIPGATTATYTVAQATRADAGWYEAEVVNAAGPAYSPPRFVLVALDQADLVAWGDAASLGLPATLTGVADAVYSRLMGAHILRADGTVTAFGGSAIPALANVVQLVGSADQRAALQSDGTVTTWQWLPGTPARVVDQRAVRIAIFSQRLAIIRADGSAVIHDLSSGRDFAEGSQVAWATALGPILRRNGALEMADENFRTIRRYDLPVPADELTDLAAGPLALTRDGRLLAWEPMDERRVARLPGGGVGLAALPSLTDATLILRRDGRLTASPPSSEFPATLSQVVHAVGEPSRGIAVIDPSPATAPVFIASPAAVSVASGGSVVLSGAVAGTGTGVAYQWYLNGTPLPNATLPTLTLRGATAASAGRYTLGATNPRGSSLSAPAVVTVVPMPNRGRLANLSVRAAAGLGPRTLIVGFVVRDVSPAPAAPLLLRALGPALQTFGVRGVLANPELRLFAGDAMLTMNDNWLGEPAVAFFGERVGAFALPEVSSSDAALVTQVRPGAYSVQVTAASGANGVALAEIYDVPPASHATATAARLVNLSTRASAGSDDATLIIGFAVAGESPCTLLLRAVGPGLAAFGVAEVLADPRIELFAGSATINANDNWNGAAAIATAARLVGAFALDPVSRDAALLVTLAPGAYTVQVSGVGGAAGVVLVEAYDVP